MPHDKKKKRKKSEIQFGNYLLSVLRMTYNKAVSRQKFIMIEANKKQQQQTHILDTLSVWIINRCERHFVFDLTVF